MSHAHSPSNDHIDADLQTRVGIALALRHRQTFRGIRFHVQHRTVTLWGDVPSFFDRQLAVATVRRVAGILRITDDLNVVDSRPAVAAEPVTRSQDEGTAVAGVYRTPVVSTAFVLILAIAALTGCNRAANRLETQPVKGTVTFNGQPLADALVVLHPQDPDVVPARANTDANGNFTLTTYDTGDGAPLGEFHVTVAYYRPVAVEGELVPGPNVIPAKYSDPVATELRVSIQKGQQELPPLSLRL